MATPIPLDLFNRYMVSMYDEREIVPVETVGQSFFGNPATGSRSLYSPDANVLDIDIIRGNRRTAALVPRGTVSEPLGGLPDTSNQRGTSFSRSYPLAQERGSIDSQQIDRRLLGLTPYAGTSRVDALRQLARETHAENIKRHVRLFERLAWQSLRTGKMDAILGTTNADLIYDFRRATANTITPTYGWGNASGVPFTDLDTACEIIRVNGKVRADGVLLGGLALTYLLTNAQIATMFANKPFFQLLSFQPGETVPEWARRLERAGAIIYGKLRTPRGYDLVVLTYAASYTNEAGSDTKFLLDTEALVFSSQARCDRFFGPPDMLPMIPQRAQWYMETFGFNPMVPPLPANIGGGVIEPAMFYVDAYPSEDQRRVTLRTQSAPIFATTMTDAFCRLVNVGTI